MDPSNLEQLIELFRSLPDPKADLRPIDFLRPSFAGLDVIERPAPKPKIETSQAFKAAFPELARAWDASLLERFGYQDQDQSVYRYGRYLFVPYGALSRSPLIGNPEPWA